MYEQPLRRMLNNAGSKHKRARQWRRFYDDRKGMFVYQLKWRAAGGTEYYEERCWHRYEVLANPNIRKLIAVSLRIMRQRLRDRTQP